MSVEDEVKDVLMGMGLWWPDANSGQLREAADAWRTFADAVEDVMASANTAARTVIDGNMGESIDAFDEFWRRYHQGHESGWLDDVAESARSIAKGLDQFADTVDDAINQLWTEIGISAAVIAAGIGLAVFTFGLSTGASAAAATTIVALSESLGVAVSAEVAGVIAATFTGATFGMMESITIDVAVAQPLRIAAGDQDSFSLDEAKDAGVSGALVGGVFGGAAGTAGAIKNAGGIGNLFNGIEFLTLRLAMAGDAPLGSSGNVLMRGGTGGSGGGRQSWTAGDGVVGAAKGKELRAPHPRHTWNGVKRGPVKAENTVVLPGYNTEIQKDIAEIAAGNATWRAETQRYEINGRTYAVESSGTIFPESGPGLVNLNRTEYSALQAIMRANGDLSQCEKFFANAHQFKQDPEAIQTAIDLYRTYTS